ncbi:hypothetical protein ABIF90_003145 [Bradyrhizobium japonicum]|jgi:hypothetical protein
MPLWTCADPPMRGPFPGERLAYGGELEELPRGGLGSGVGTFPDEFYIAAKSSFTPRATIRNAPSASGR